jgi:hypothetical protein
MPILKNAITQSFTKEAQRKNNFVHRSRDSFGDFYEVSLCTYFVKLCDIGFLKESKLIQGSNQGTLNVKL